MRCGRQKDHPELAKGAAAAQVAIHNDAPLLTDNVKDFPMSDLELYPLPA